MEIRSQVNNSDFFFFLAEEWDALEPRGLYAGHLRTPLLWCVAACGALPELCSRLTANP